MGTREAYEHSGRAVWGFGQRALPSSRVLLSMGYLLLSSGTVLNAFVAGTQG